MRTIRLGTGSAAAALSVLAVLAQPGVALAATVLNDGQWATPRGPQPAVTDYTVTTTRPYWSVALLRPGYIQASSADQITEYHLQVLNPAGTVLATSAFTDSVPDFVAMDGNIVGAQRYTARVNRVRDNNPGEQYGLTFADGGSVVAAPGVTTINATTTSQPNNVYVRDVYLPANMIVTITVGGVNQTCPSGNLGTLYLHTYLMASNLADRSTAVQGRASALDSSRNIFQNGNACSTQVGAVSSRAGWYGLVVFTPNWPQLTVTVHTTSIDIIS